jgi:transcriptional regulator with XRE-family HTH domain
MPTGLDRVSLRFKSLVEASPKTQLEIAREAGLVSPNTISMIKTGKTKLPIARIPALANALDADPLELFSLALETYEPEIWNVFVSLAPSMLVSRKELELIVALRKAARTGALK